MAYRRRVSRRRPMRRPRRMLRRRIYRNRRLYRKRSIVHNFKRCIVSSINLQKSANTAGFQTVHFQDIPNYTEFTALFDQYRINGLKFEFMPRFNSIDQTAAYGQEFYTVIDRNDESVPGTLNVMLDYQSLRKTPITRKHVRYFKPGVLFGLLEEPETTPSPLSPSSTKLSPWININTSTGLNVDHLGLKYFSPATGAASNTTIDVIITAYFQCRTVK